MPNIITAARLREIKQRKILWDCDERTQDLVFTLERAVELLKAQPPCHCGLCLWCQSLEEFYHD